MGGAESKRELGVPFWNHILTPQSSLVCLQNEDMFFENMRALGKGGFGTVFLADIIYRGEKMASCTIKISSVVLQFKTEMAIATVIGAVIIQEHATIANKATRATPNVTLGIGGLFVKDTRGIDIGGVPLESIETSNVGILVQEYTGAHNMSRWVSECFAPVLRAVHRKGSARNLLHRKYVQGLGAQLFHAIAFLHAAYVTHRDIYSNNITMGYGPLGKEMMTGAPYAYGAQNQIIDPFPWICDGNPAINLSLIDIGMTDRYYDQSDISFKDLFLVSPTTWRYARPIEQMMPLLGEEAAAHFHRCVAALSRFSDDAAMDQVWADFFTHSDASLTEVSYTICSDLWGCGLLLAYLGNVQISHDGTTRDSVLGYCPLTKETIKNHPPHAWFAALLRSLYRGATRAAAAKNIDGLTAQRWNFFVIVSREFDTPEQLVNFVWTFLIAFGADHILKTSPPSWLQRSPIGICLSFFLKIFQTQYGTQKTLDAFPGTLWTEILTPSIMGEAGMALARRLLSWDPRKRSKKKRMRWKHAGDILTEDPFFQPLRDAPSRAASVVYDISALDRVERKTNEFLQRGLDVLSGSADWRTTQFPLIEGDSEEEKKAGVRSFLSAWRSSCPMPLQTME